MENTSSYSLDISQLPKSFFSSFSSQVSNSTWKPLLNSLQENQRLSRVIQERESKLQELKCLPQPTHSFLSTSASESNIADLNKPQHLDKLDSLICHSQKNLKILSTKLGKLPRNLCKAMDIVQIRPESLATSEKLECLSAMEILRERFIDYTADSEEMLGYFKDILLESEAVAVGVGNDRDDLMKIVDKRVGIFQSGDSTRTKIQEAYHLIMRLEQWKSRNYQGVGENSEGLVGKQRGEAEIKMNYAEVIKKNQEIIELKERYRKKAEKLTEVCKGLAGELKKVKHCVEYELFNTWSCLIGDEGSKGVSCDVIYKKISQAQKREQMRDRLVREKLCKIKRDFEISKDFVRAGLKDMSQDFILAKDEVLKAVLGSRKQIQSCKNEFVTLRSSTKVDLEDIQENLRDFCKNKLIFAGNIEQVQKNFLKIKENSEQSASYFNNHLESFKSDIKNYKGNITKKLTSFSSKIKCLKSEKTSLKMIAVNSLKNFNTFFNNSVALLKSGKMREISQKVINLKSTQVKVRADTKHCLMNISISTVQSMNQIKNAQLSWLSCRVKTNKIELSDLKKSISKDLSEFKNIFQSLALLQNNLAENHIKSKQELAYNSQEQLSLKNDLKTSNETISLLHHKLSQANSTISLQSQGLKSLKSQHSSLKSTLKSAIDSTQAELNLQLQQVKTSSNALQTAYESLQLHSTLLESTNQTLSADLKSCRSLLLSQEKLVSDLANCKSVIPILRASLSKIKKDLIDSQAHTSSDLCLMKSHVSATSARYNRVRLHVLQLQQEKMELENKHTFLGRKLEQATEINKQLMQYQESKKTLLKRNGQRVLRKLRAFKSVLIQEKSVIKYFNRNLYEWIVPNVVMALEQKYSDREVESRYRSDEGMSRVRLQMKESREMVGEYNQEMRLAAISIKSIIEGNNKAIMNDFREQILRLVDLHSEEIGRYKRIVIAKNSYIDRLRQAQKDAFEVLRKENYELRMCVDSLLKLSITERDSIKVKLSTKLKSDLEGMKISIKNIKDEYKKENFQIQSENLHLQKILDARNSLVTPIDQLITVNQSSFQELRKICIKNYERNHQNIEENVKKLDDFSWKIVELYDEGLEIVNKYKQASYPDISPEVSLDIFDIPEAYDQELSENSCEISLTSNPDDEENKISLTTNPLMKKFSSKSNKLIRIPTLIKTIESILDEKYRIDNEALQRDRPPLTMTEYLLQYLKNQYNLMADTRLNTILHSFRTSISDPRIRFYCRLFQVFDSKPISYKLSLYLVKLRYYFNVFVNNQVIPESLNKKSDKMQITETLKRVRRLFNSDIPTGEVVLKQMMPDSLQSGTWSRICIQYYLYINGISPEKCFTSITLDPTMTETQFVHGLSKIHETFVNEGDLRQLFTEICQGILNISEFEKVFALKFYFDNHQKYNVDQMQFLNALIEGYSCMRIRHYKELQQLIVEKCGNKDRFSRDEVCLLVKALDPGAEASDIFVNGIEEVTVREFRRKIFELNVGGKGIGCFNLKSIEKIYDGKLVDEEESKA